MALARGVCDSPSAARAPGHHHYPKPMSSPAGRQHARPPVRRLWAMIACGAAMIAAGAFGGAATALAGAPAPFAVNRIVVRYAAKAATPPRRGALAARAARLPAADPTRG